MKFHHLSQLPVLIQTKHFSEDQDHSFHKSSSPENTRSILFSFLTAFFLVSRKNAHPSLLKSVSCILYFLKCLLFIKYLSFLHNSYHSVSLGALLSCVLLVFQPTLHYVVEASLELTMVSRMALNCPSSSSSPVLGL